MKLFFTLAWFLIACSFCFGQRFRVDTLQKTGPLAKRINVVILGDGFTQSELPKFDQEAQKFMAFFLGYTPYNAYKNYFNFFSIRVPSTESGATNPGTAPDRYPNQPVETKDTYFGSSFGTNNIHRSVSIRKYQAFSTVMATNFPSYDLAIMIVNSPWYGGSGGNPATFTLDVQASLIGVHEIGHLFSSLADEYWPGISYTRETANMTRNPDPSSVVWRKWLNQNNVSIFQHTGDADAVKWYKPTTHNCLMEQLDKPFCTVCREVTTNRILQLVKPVEAVQPAEGRIRVEAQPKRFQLDLLKPNPNTLRVEWKLNGMLMNRDSAQISLSNEQLVNLSNTLTVTVFDSTAYIRAENHRLAHTYTYQWTLDEAVDATTLTLSSAQPSVCSGETTTLTALNCTGSITWSTGATNTSISVSPTQSSTYSATCAVTGLAAQTATIGVTVFPLPVANVSNTGPYLEGQTIQLMANGGATYSWKGPAGFISTEQNPIIRSALISRAGTYTVVVTSANGCVSSAQTTVTISPVLATPNLMADGVWVSPNPAQHRVRVEATLPGKLEVTLLDAVGHEILKKEFYQTTELNTETLPKAVYFYRVRNDQRVITGKLIIDGQ